MGLKLVYVKRRPFVRKRALLATLSGILVTRYFLFHHCSKLSLWLRKKVVSIQIYDYTETNSIVFTPIGGWRNGLPHQYGNV